MTESRMGPIENEDLCSSPTAPGRRERSGTGKRVWPALKPLSPPASELGPLGQEGRRAGGGEGREGGGYCLPSLEDVTAGKWLQGHCGCLWFQLPLVASLMESLQSRGVWRAVFLGRCSPLMQRSSPHPHPHQRGCLVSHWLHQSFVPPYRSSQARAGTHDTEGTQAAAVTMSGP